MELETDRLILRQFCATDFEYFSNYFEDATLTKFIGGIKNKEQAWRLMATYIGHWQIKGFGKMAVVEKATNKFAGCAGLWKSDAWPELELGYWFLKEMQGKGYATEAAQRLKIFAFENLKADTLVSYIHPDNTPSQRLAERLGGQQEEMIELFDFGPHYIYRYSKDN